MTLFRTKKGTEIPYGYTLNTKIYSQVACRFCIFVKKDSTADIMLPLVGTCLGGGIPKTYFNIYERFDVKKLIRIVNFTFIIRKRLYLHVRIVIFFSFFVRKRVEKNFACLFY